MAQTKKEGVKKRYRLIILNEFPDATGLRPLPPVVVRKRKIETVEFKSHFASRVVFVDGKMVATDENLRQEAHA